MEKFKRTKWLRRLLLDDDFVIIPGCFSTLSARLIEQAGFDANYISGTGMASNYLGYPDIGLITMTQIIENAGNIVDLSGYSSLERKYTAVHT